MSQVRSEWRACRVPGLKEPYDTAHLRVFYPARATGSDAERLTGVIAADAGRAPFPLVVLLPGINVPADSYRWLAVLLARRGFVAVTPELVGELFGGSHGVTPGIDLAACTPGAYGTRATTPLLGAVLAALAEPAPGSPLDGLLDPERVVLGGHSAGGTVALQSAAHVPGLRGVFTYGAHTRVAAALGHPPGTVLPVGARVPVLLMSGEHDGVIAASAERYALTDADADPVARTFHEALTDSGGAHAWVRIAGAGHFALCDPVDATSARGFLEEPEPEGSGARALAGRLVAAFCSAVLLPERPAAPNPDDQAELDALLAPPHPGLLDVRRR
ncbi:alpha/beta hydrolase [Streptomyces sp. ms191]|uniref:dienelactone hydrolase family protein n=1 Tax=Streptomyces sp. ms191 TaxID=1827978 RepID=UPI0011CE1D51|nr:alpha/beta hydrolase [Streptomyces sp. ms191]TXS09957.1 alpha/beta hydrolase [Streptomyces sp. ms191]